MPFDPLKKLPFVLLPEHNFATAAFEAAVKHGVAQSARILFVYGPSGCGKSAFIDHMMSFVPSWLPSSQILNMSASTFVEHYLEASTSSLMPEFHQLFAEHNLWVCDDILALQQKPAAQNAFLSAADEVLSNNGVLIVTATQSPGSLNGFSSRLLSRFLACTACPINLPCAESRFLLLQTFTQFHDLSIDDDRLLTLAQSPLPPRLLFAAATRESTVAHVSDRAFVVHERPSLERICMAVSKQFDVSVNELLSPNRAARIATARHCAVYIARTASSASLRQIANFFNRPNHSTITHSIHRFEELLRDSPEIKVRFDRILDFLNAHSFVQ
ncbi:MAG: hypothetical protein CMJ78_26765 [Planctomycetaceae bacterium]|nr:hypothetical protein [Planctomycetaceae bacterium]